MCTVGDICNGTCQSGGPRICDGELDPDVCTGPGGRSIVVWRTSPPTSLDKNIHARLLDADGIAVGGERIVSAEILVDDYDPSVACPDTGGFVAAWESADGSGVGVLGRRLDDDGMPLGPVFQVNAYTTGRQHRAEIAADPSGGFVVVWTDGCLEGEVTGGCEEPSPDRSLAGVMARKFDADGQPVAGQFVVNTTTAGSQGFRGVDVASMPDGRFMVVWSTHADDPGCNGFVPCDDIAGPRGAAAGLRACRAQLDQGARRRWAGK